MLDYRSLLALAAVNSEGSYERAATRLNVTPSAISQRIKALEARVCGKVLVRGARGQLTPLGTLLVKHATQVNALEQELLGPLKIHNLRADGILKIIVSAEHLSLWFMEAICEYLHNNHSLNIEIISASSESAEEILNDSLAIAAVTDKRMNISGYRSLLVGKWEHLAVSTLNVFTKYNSHEQFSEDVISDLNCFRSCRKGNIPVQWTKKVFGRDLLLKYVTVPSSHDILRALENNVGWSALPGLQAIPHLESGRLIRFCDNVSITTPVYWHHPANAGGALADLTKVVRRVASNALRSVAAS
ncbi:MAG: ArgP/LysG family DNA-binding transcriptional regulator [Salinarimonas sp.]